MQFIYAVVLPVVISTLFVNDSAPVPAVGGPLNDQCGSVLPQFLPVGGGLTFLGSTQGATFDGDYEEGSPLHGFGIPVVWHAFTLPACADVTLDYCASPTSFGTSFWELFARGCPAGSDLVFATSYTLDSCSGNNPFALFPGLPAGTYYYPVAAVPGGPAGPYEIQVTASACQGVPPAPANDLCSSLTPVFVAEEDTVQLTGDNTGATATGDFVAGSPFNGSPVVWHAVVLDACVDLSVSYCGLAPAWTSTIGALATGCPADQVVFFSTTTDTVCGDGNTTYTYQGLAAGTYYLPVLADEVNGSVGPYTLELISRSCGQGPEPPVNDLCGAVPVSALVAGGELSFSGNNTNATDTDDFVAGSIFEGAPVTWHAFSTTMCLDVRVSYCGTAVPWSNTLGVLALACPGDEVVQFTSIEGAACGNGNTVYVFKDLPVGTYHLPVLSDVVSGSSGAYSIAVSGTQCLTGAAPDDICAGAVPVDLQPGAPVQFVGDNTDATAIGDFVDGSSLAGSAVNWHAFTTTECTDVSISYCGQDPVWDNTLGVLAMDCPADSLVPFSAVNGTECPDGNVSYRFDQLPAGTYYVPVLKDAIAGSAGAYSVSVVAMACGAEPPANDGCGVLAAVALSVGDTVVFDGDNTLATADGDFAAGSSFFGATASWHSFTLDGCSRVRISYCAVPTWSNVLGGLATDCPADSIVLADSMDLQRCDGNGITFEFAELAAGTYHLPVLADAASGSIGAYSVEVVVAACAGDVPANDACVDVVPTTLEPGVPLVFNGTNIGASVDDGLGVPVVWEAFSIDTCADVRIAYCGASPAYGEVMSVLYAACPATAPIAAAAVIGDDCGFGDPNSTLVFEALQPGSYWVPVRWVPGTSAGAYTLTLTASVCVEVPTNDGCAQAQDVEVVAPGACEGGTAGTTVGASVGGADPGCGFPGAQLQDVWYAFNTGDRTAVDIELVLGTMVDPGIEVYAACGDTALVCVLGDAITDLAVEPDVDLLVRVFSYADLGAAGTFTICISGDPGMGITSWTSRRPSLYPNPVRGAFRLEGLLNDGPLDLHFMDLSGRLAHSQRVVVRGGAAVVVQRPAGLAPGTYVLQAQGAGGRWEWRVVME